MTNKENSNGDNTFKIITNEDMYQKLEAIYDEVKKTNGRVTALEHKHKNLIAVVTTVLGAIGVMAVWIITKITELFGR